MAKSKVAKEENEKENLIDPFKEIDDVISKQFDDLVDISKIDTSVKTWYDSGVYSFNYICSKNIHGAYAKGRIIGLDGLSGTGKSLLASVAMRDPKIDYVVIIESEGGGNSDELITFAGVDKRKVRIIKSSTFVSYKVNKKTKAIEEIADKNVPKNKDTETFYYVEGAGSILRRFAQTIQFGGLKKNILIILDSLGNMQSIRGMAGGMDMGKRGQDITNFFKNFDNEFEKAGLTFLFTNKLYQSFDPYHPYVQTGGESPIYNSSLYIRLSTTTDSDDVTNTEMEIEKERRKSALGSSLKTIKMNVVKSRFGTEMRNIPFLLDFAVGPVRMSGLFRLLIDFGVIKKINSSRYELPGVIEGSFFKKDFVDLILKDEENNINKIQELLELREIEIKNERRNIQASDMEDVEEKIIEMGDDPFGFDSDEMKKEFIKDYEG